MTRHLNDKQIIDEANHWFSADAAGHSNVIEFVRALESRAAISSAVPDGGKGEAGCSMGVGCDEAGVCYAMAHGQPERCAAPQAEHMDGGKGEAVGYVNAQWANDRRGTTTIYAEPRPRLATFALYTAPQAECAPRALTDEEIEAEATLYSLDLANGLDWCFDDFNLKAFVRAIELTLKEQK